MAANSKASGFSWADEVEKEEAEAQAQAQGPRKSNPFGSARPREIVLQEKGINWRKLDEQLRSSNIRKEKQPAATPSANEQKRYPSRSGILATFPAQIQQATCPAICGYQHVHNPLVPPLRYPPKNVMALMENGSQCLCVVGSSASERENENYQNIGYISGQRMQPSNVHAMGAGEEKENMKSERGREFFGNISSFPPEELQMKRGSILGAGFLGNVDGGSAYDIKNIKESNFNCGNPRGGQLKMKKSDEARAYKDRAGRVATGGEASSVNTDGIGGRRKFHSDRRNFEGNYKKRGQISSAAGVKNCQQKRRK